MNVYADHAFYQEKYGGESISMTDFPAVSVNASQYIRYITLGRSDRYEGEEVKYAMCAVADIYQSVFGKANAEMSEKKSETIDGYSVSYVNQGKDGETKEALFRRKAYEKAEFWLSGTGLLNRRVGC